MVDENPKSHPKRQGNFLHFRAKKGDNKRPIVRVSKTYEFYDHPDQLHQLSKESG